MSLPGSEGTGYSHSHLTQLSTGLLQGTLCGAAPEGHLEASISPQYNDMTVIGIPHYTQVIALLHKLQRLPIHIQVKFKANSKQSNGSVPCMAQIHLFLGELPSHKNICPSTFYRHTHTKCDLCYFISNSRRQIYTIPFLLLFSSRQPLNEWAWHTPKERIHSESPL